MTYRLPAVLMALIAAAVTLAAETEKGVESNRMQNATSSADYKAVVIEDGGRVDFVFGDDRPFAECHASTVVEAPDGSLLCAWFGGTREKDPDVSVWISRFNGTSWSPPERTAKVGEIAHWNPVLFRDSNDIVYLFFKVGVDEVNWSTYWMQTQDAGESWSKPMPLVEGDVGGRGPVKNKPIILSDGTWLAPASLERKEGEREIWTAFSERSTDNGKTWVRSADFALPDERDERYGGPGAIQPTFWESSPGTVHALMRTGAGVAWRTDSSDGGITWSTVAATDLPNNNSGFDALRLEDGRVLLVYNPVGEDWGPRTPLDLAVSTRNGATWRTMAHLEDDPNEESEYSYPAIVRTKDGIAVTYTWKRERIRCWQIPMAALDSES